MDCTTYQVACVDGAYDKLGMGRVLEDLEGPGNLS